VASGGAGSAGVVLFESDGKFPLSVLYGEIHVYGLGAGVDGVADAAVAPGFFRVVDVEVVEVFVAVSEASGGG